jgi:hypothetical protein
MIKIPRTTAICPVYFLFIVLNIPVPTIGPKSHPTPPQPNVINPSVMKGSNGICDTIASISDIASPCAPPTMLTRLVPMLDPSCNRLRDFRSAKNVFQSSLSLDAGAAGLEDAVVLFVVVLGD